MAQSVLLRKTNEIWLSLPDTKLTMTETLSHKKRPGPTERRNRRTRSAISNQNQLAGASGSVGGGGGAGGSVQ
jgi:hypothetical protein